MQHYALRSGGIVKISEDEALASSALLPGEFAKYLDRKYGLARRFFPVDSWLVENDKPERVRVAMVIGERMAFVGPPALAILEDGRQVSAGLLFPVARHQKPRLLAIPDEMGPTTQWAAPMRTGSRKHWD